MKVTCTVYYTNKDYKQQEKEVNNIDDIFTMLDIASMFADEDVNCISAEFEYEGSEFELKKYIRHYQK